MEDQEEPADIALSWEGFDPDFVIHNSFGTQQRQQLLSIPPVDFLSGIFVGGDFRVHPIEVQGNKVYLAIRGQWQAFEDQQQVRFTLHLYTLFLRPGRVSSGEPSPFIINCLHNY